MSEVIENYIRRHPGLNEKEAFEGFLQEDRIRSWVGTDATRRERLRAEFGRTWATMAPQPTARSGPAGPALQQQPAMKPPLRVEITEPPVEAPPPPPSPPPQRAQPSAPIRVDITSPAARKLSVLCTNCKHMDVWMQGEAIVCRRCHHAYDDMLSLIRVTPVGPFEYLFGDGVGGVATAVGILAGLVGLYYLLRWL